MEEYASFVEDLADAAGKIILKYWRKSTIVEDKVESGRPIPKSPVTIADREAEAKMRSMINAKYPNHGIYGEEYGKFQVDAEYIWVLDPIDGTKSFITGKPLFGTLIALLHNGKPIVGVIDQCVSSERWVGISGKYTQLNGRRVSAKGCTMLSQALLFTTTPHMFSPGFEETRFMKLRKQVKHTLYGTDCYGYALVASGFGADLVVESDLGLYDYCALVPVLKSAGAIITDWKGRELTLQNHELSCGRVVAAANRELHSKALSILSDEREDLTKEILEAEIERLRNQLENVN